MAYEQKPNSGTLWVNDRKEKETHPDRKGDGLIHCPHCSHNFEVWLSGWIRTKKDGGKFLSMSIKSKEDPGAAPAQKEAARKPAAPPRPPADPDLDVSDSDIPF
jgi:hypothetical protein